MNKEQRSYTITPVSPKDAKDILTYSSIIGGESHNLSFGKDGIPITIEQEEAFLQAVCDDPTNKIWKVTMNHELIGLASVSAFPRKRMAHRGELAISVRKSHWHMGIGRALLETILTYARANEQLNLLWLEVIEDNTRAIKLYESYGFTKVGYAKRYTCVDGVYYGAYLMDMDV